MVTKYMRKILCFFSLLMATMAVANDYLVKDYGAKADGKTLDHQAINQAIEAAHAAGGGRVVLSTGTYL
ncbi:MAG: glycoside hydrolase family 28 protein, partial [Prevotella sp.]|nr:glycoside hydrolase family 28 protein [Prevotella sp.]